jgi:hypothetical protein
MNVATSGLKRMLPKEHGAYIILITSMITGIARARSVTSGTVLTVFMVGFAYLSYTPLLQWMRSKERTGFRSQPFIYGITGMGLAVMCSIPLFLSLRYFGVFIGVGALVYVFAFFLNRGRQKRMVVNEFIVFASLCAAAPLGYYASTGTLNDTVLTLWIFNLLFFCSTIFSVKIRLHGKAFILPTAIYMTLAALVLCGFAFVGVFPWQLLLAFVPLLLKISFYSLRPEWFRNARLQAIGVIETFAAAAFAVLVIFL